MLLPRFGKTVRKTVSTRFSAIAESVNKIIGELSIQDGNRLIIVEGHKDRVALIKLGVKTRIMTLRDFLRLASTDWIEKNNLVEVIVLTDFDKKGCFYSRMIRKICSGRVRVNTEYKGRLKQALGSWVKDVEGIPGFWENSLDENGLSSV